MEQVQRPHRLIQGDHLVPDATRDAVKVPRPQHLFLTADEEDRRVLIPYNTLKKMYPAADDVNLRAQAQAGRLPEAVDQIREVLERRRNVPFGGKDNFSINTAEQQVAQFHDMVDTVALAGDPVARDIIVNAAQQLAILANSVARRLFRAGDTVLVCYIGGMFRSRLLLERYRRIVELEDGVRCQAPRYSPAAGALLEAYRAAGLHPALIGVPE